MKNFAILRKDRTILVKTPRPYIVDAYKDKRVYPDVNLDDVRHDLDEHTRFLYNCLKMLNISRKQAIFRNYTLNISTGEALNDIARNKDNVSHEMRMAILNHEW